MVHQNSMRFQDQIAYDENYSGLIISTEEGDRLAKVLGDKNIMMMGNHGVLTVGTWLLKLLFVLTQILYWKVLQFPWRLILYTISNELACTKVKSKYV